MALSHELPIYRDTSELLNRVVVLTQNIHRAYKRQLSEKLFTGCIEATVLIFRANVATNPAIKVERILEIREQLQVVELILRMCKDKHWISDKQHASVMKLTQSIGKQATGWMRSSKGSPEV